MDVSERSSSQNYPIKIKLYLKMKINSVAKATLVLRRCKILVNKS